MGFFDFLRRDKTPARTYAPNPHRNPKIRSAGFSSGNVDRLLTGWDSQSYSIDYYLQTELRPLRARSRAMVRANPYGKRFVSVIKSNVVGPSGVIIQAQTMRGREPDILANDAIEKAWRDWGNRHCDVNGRYTWADMQNMAIACAAQDGEFLFEKIYSKGGYGLKLRCIDPELLDAEKNTRTKRGGEIRLGVEYDKQGRVIRYHFRKPKRGLPYTAGYQGGETYTIPAPAIIHGFIGEWPDQSRGIPWMHSSLERSKHLEKYDEAAIVKARSTAATMAVLKSPTGEAPYTGSEDGVGEYDDATLDQYEAGTIKDIGDRDIVQLDSDYPHEMYADFVKSHLRGIAAGLGISYHSLSNDLEGVNYSSIRAGVMEDREIFKGLQNWFIRTLVAPVFDDWLVAAYSREAIKIGSRPLSRNVDDYRNPHFQPRRWAWVDPQKDGLANQMALDNRLKSYSQLMREQGDDPDSVWREMARDQEMMKQLGIAPVSPTEKPLMEVSGNDDEN